MEELVGSAQTSGSLQILYGVSFADANNGIIVGFAGEILTTTDGGSNWIIQSRGTNPDTLRSIIH